MPIKKKGETKPKSAPKEEQTDIEDHIPETEDEQPEHDGMGHNGGPSMTEEDGHETGNVKADDAIKTKLADFARAIEGLRDQKKELADQEKDVFKEAKAVGFDVKALRAALAARKVDREERREAEDMRDFYLEILEERM